MLEKFLTYSEDEFKQFMHAHPKPEPTPEDNMREAYRYAKVTLCYCQAAAWCSF